MSEADDAPEMAQPAANPDAQTTVNDFLDYTEFFPSDLVRSLTLIADLDSTYSGAVQQVHELTVQYGQLPALPEPERPDPVLLRRRIAQHLQKAISQREFAYTEASRLYEVTVRHCQRSSVIKRKLQAQPQPPSRDPTPPPVSPSAHRPVNRNYERAPHLRLTFDGGRHGANTSRPRDRHRKTAIPLPRGRGRMRHDYDSSDSELGSGIDVVSPRKRKDNRDRHARSTGGRSRAAGVLGTNVHSSIAGISTSNALAQLAPPPADAKPGSKWAPWKKLTEYEMAVLRKQMKKNAVWTPSQTMMIRELEKKHRTEADYESEKARCEATGEHFLDEEPETLQQIMTASGLGLLAPHGPQAANPPPPTEPAEEDAKEETGPVSIRLKPVATKEGRKLDRTSQRQKAMQDAQELIGAAEKIREAANSLKELNFNSGVATPASQKKKAAVRSSNKRKRDTSPLPTIDSATEATREASVATQDSSSRPPEPKRARLQLIAPAPHTVSSPTLTPVSTPRDLPASVVPSPASNIPVPLPEPTKPSTNGNTVQVPLAPAGPSTPKVENTVLKEQSPELTPITTSPVAPEESPAVPSAPPSPAPVRAHSPAPASVSTAPPAASARSTRGSVAPKAATPPVAPLPPAKSSKTPTPAPESAPETPTAPTLRPRSARGHVPTLKAQSEEPKPGNGNEEVRMTRETRRHSVFSQPASTSTAVPPAAPSSTHQPSPAHQQERHHHPTMPTTRTSSRRKPPPKGEVTVAEDGQKTVTNVKRAQGSKNKKRSSRRAEGRAETSEEVEVADEIDPDEPRYCICDDVSYGQMISCDNNCDKEWFHLPCMNMTEDDIPSRRAKWYCPDCRASLGTDAYGNPLVPPPLPGRRGAGSRSA